MHKLISTIMVTMCLSIGLHAQGQVARYQVSQVVDNNGRPVRNPQVRVCTELASGTTCTPIATIYSDLAGTPLANPFSGDAQGNAYFYASTAARYHVQINGTGISQIDIGDIVLMGSFVHNIIAQAYGATETFDASTGDIFTLTLTGNVTSSSVTNATAGQILAFRICQDGVGSRTFAWPANFTRPPSMVAASSACISQRIFYDGANWKMLSATGDSLSLSTSTITNGAATVTLPSSSVNVTLPSATDTLVGKATTDILSNKTIASPGLPIAGATSGTTTLAATGVASGTLTLPATTDTLVAKNTTDILTNKTIGGTNAVADTALTSNVALYNNGSKTWGPGAGFTWTFDGSGGTDPTFAFSDGLLTLGGLPNGISVNGSLTIAPVAAASSGLEFDGGSGSPAGSGGGVTILGGTGGTGATNGGLVSITAGTAGSGGTGGTLTLQGGGPTSTGAGGSVVISGRNGGGSGLDGGSVTITAGNGQAAAKNGGNITLTPGTTVSGTAGKVVINGLVGTYNSTTTAGQGVAWIPCVTSQKPEAGADTNVLTCTPPAAVGSYRIRFSEDVSAANTATLGWTAAWTDSNAHAQAPTNLSLFKTGTAAPALTFSGAANDHYYGSIEIDTDNSGTAIVVKLTFTGTSFASKTTASVERIN